MFIPTLMRVISPQRDHPRGCSSPSWAVSGRWRGDRTRPGAMADASPGGLVGGFNPTPLKNHGVKVSWDDYPLVN